MKSIKHLLLGLSLFAFAGGAAFAAGDKPAGSTTGASPSTSGAASGSMAGGKDFTALDADKDGSISMTEADSDASLKAKFKTLDKDGDGKLSRSEYEAAGAAGATGSSTPGGTSSTKQ